MLKYNLQEVWSGDVVLSGLEKTESLSDGSVIISYPSKLEFEIYANPLFSRDPKRLVFVGHPST